MDQKEAAMTGRSVRMDEERWDLAAAFGDAWGVSVSEVLRRAVDGLNFTALDYPLPGEDDQYCPQSVQFPHLFEPSEEPVPGESVMCIAQPDGVFCGCTFTWDLFSQVTARKQQIQRARAAAGGE